MSIYTRVAAVTGSNKGVGLGCVRNLALQYPKSSFNNGPFLIYMTARNKERGEAALQAMQEDAQLQSAKALRSQGGLTDIKYLPLDISSEQSLKDFITTIKAEHPDGIDIMINNAGVAFDGFNIDIVKRTLACNYFATVDATLQMIPHVRGQGRIVNVASAAGYLKPTYSQEIRERFLNATTTAEITDLMNKFIQDVQDDKLENQWPAAGYAVSKAGLIGATRTIALQNAKSGSKILINSCCPGYVNTDMTKGRGTKTLDQGAETLVLLALGDIKGSNGEFWTEGKPVSWETA